MRAIKSRAPVEFIIANNSVIPTSVASIDELIAPIKTLSFKPKTRTAITPTANARTPTFIFFMNAIIITPRNINNAIMSIYSFIPFYYINNTEVYIFG